MKKLISIIVFCILTACIKDNCVALFIAEEDAVAEISGVKEDDNLILLQMEL